MLLRFLPHTLTGHALLMLLIEGPLIQEKREAKPKLATTGRGRGGGRGSSRAKSKAESKEKEKEDAQVKNVPDEEVKKRPAKPPPKKRPAAACEVLDEEVADEKVLKKPSISDADAQGDSSTKKVKAEKAEKDKAETFHNPSWHKGCNNWCLKSSSRHIMSVAHLQNESQSSCLCGFCGLDWTDQQGWLFRHREREIQGSGGALAIFR